MIKAQAHSDDYQVVIDFDATNWFETATDQEIVELIECEWGGDYPSDDIAKTLSETNKDLAQLFNYLDIIQDDPAKKNVCGFECKVDELSAIEWMKKHRPHLASFNVP